MDITRIKNRAYSLAGEMTSLRRYFHENPELSWQEFETSRTIASKLQELGFEKPIVGTGDQPVGVVADLAGSSAGPCVALRAEIDAIAIMEDTGVSYKSSNPGVMHACAHDAHIAILLTVAKMLLEMREELAGKVRFIFQPAEEHGYRSGAQAMINDGVLEGVSAIAGMHLWPDVPIGKTQWRTGPVMASVDGWKVVFRGKGGHGAVPQGSVDPTLAAAAFISALQTIVSREIDPLETAVVSVGKLASGSAFNVIPDFAELAGNVRTFNRTVRDGVEERLRRIAEGVGMTYRCKAETRYEDLYPNPVVNDDILTLLFRDTAMQVVGAENVERTSPKMTSEDFSFYQAEIPGCLFFVGSGGETKRSTAAHHSPHFDVDDNALPIGAALTTSFVCAMLERA
ncbi:MAG: amidohydrolase [Synergistaceae bacterium]|jgi:amidohydrolase|nr:amidohydrolase [Synergistaceae bacterium]